jgi:hypothetical protein
MSGRWGETHERPGHQHTASPGASRRRCLYEIVVRQAIATQHGLTSTERLELHACDDCGKPYLLTSVWQPHSESGEIACPRCGACAIAWEGARGYLAYWQREERLAERRPRSASAPAR